MISKIRLVNVAVILLVVLVLCYFIGYSSYRNGGALNVDNGSNDGSSSKTKFEHIAVKNGNQQQDKQCRMYYHFDAPSWTLKYLRPEAEIDLECKSNLTVFIKGGLLYSKA